MKRDSTRASAGDSVNVGVRRVHDAAVRLDVRLQIDGTRLIARIATDAALPDASYAFYLLKGERRVATRVYAPDAVASFEQVTEAGEYRVRGFVRCALAGRALAATSNPVAFGPYAPALRRVLIASLPAQPTTGDGPIRTDQLYLANTGTRARCRGNAIEYQPRADVVPYVLEFPLDWSVDPYKDRNWSAQLHMWRMVDFMLFAAERRRDFDSLLPFVTVVRDWYRYHVVEQRPSVYAWKDMMVGIRAMKLAFLISQWQHRGIRIDEVTLAMLHDLVQTHLGFLLDLHNVRYSNHTLSDLHGAMALAQVVDRATRATIESFVAAVLPKVLDAQFDGNGVHLENSVGYHSYGIAYLSRLLAARWFDRFGIAAIVERAERVLGWFRLPDGRLAAVGDTDGASPPGSIGRPVFAGRDELFDASGYVIVRDDGGGDLQRAAYLLFMGAYNSKFHKQADDLSVLWYHGEEILCDAGKYAYKTDEMRSYVISRRAHNTVDIDRAPDHRLSGPPYGSAVETVQSCPWGHLILGRVRLETERVTHRRAVLHSLTGWLLVVDRLDGERAHDYVQWSHFAPAIDSFTPAQGGFDTRLASGRRLLIRTIGDGDVTLELVRGILRPRRQGWISQAYRKLEPNNAFGVNRRGAAKATIATLYSVDAACALGWSGPGVLIVTVGMVPRQLRLVLREDGIDVEEIS
jgi:hypothetical protein